MGDIIILKNIDMTDLKKTIREFLLEKEFVEQPSSAGVCYMYRSSKGEWQGIDWAEVRFPKGMDYSNIIEASTGYTGAYTGDEGYEIARYRGVVNSLDEFLNVLELTKINSQTKKGKNSYVFSQLVAKYNGR